MTDYIIPPKNLEDLAKKFGLGVYARPGTGKGEGKPPIENVDETILEDGEYFLFPNIKYEDGFVDVRLTKNLLGRPDKKTQTQWWEFSQQPDEERIVPNMRILYKLMHRCYKLRNENKLIDVVNSCVSGLRKDFDDYFPHTGTRIKYENGLEAEISEIHSDKSISTKNVDIPEFEKQDDNWSYLVLAKEQPESALGSIEPISEEAKPFLEALLGDNYEEAGAVFQYIISRKSNGVVREVRLWVPTLSNRNATRAVVLGRDIYGSRFNVGCGYVSCNGPARGVVVVGAPK